MWQSPDSLVSITVNPTHTRYRQRDRRKEYYLTINLQRREDDDAAYSHIGDWFRWYFREFVGNANRRDFISFHLRRRDTGEIWNYAFRRDDFKKDDLLEIITSSCYKSGDIRIIVTVSEM